MAASIVLAAAVFTPGVAVAAPSTSATTVSPAATAGRCELADFIGFTCNYYYGTAYSDYGDSGAKVKEIQALLRDVFGYSIGRSGVDGQFGTATRSAVIRFQSDRGLSPDGIVGPNTWYHLRTPGA
ncbi:peptidoglycan-binding protein [Streptomyces sp. TRM66268-LWL]|uniref:Peptidoglycan-binding protein n=1 Tax=Streptomyces polyasparticus TaxID=2767826 RepID=A0ABR7SKR2_9ACTN|nr:peptidoglycan-binding domain-containing protein [Streptomyces polyasparticus]MBC9715894.1 peptidoglycan-binding protein [Streptomyces polyasparticus]